MSALYRNKYTLGNVNRFGHPARTCCGVIAMIDVYHESPVALVDLLAPSRDRGKQVGGSREPLSALG